MRSPSHQGRRMNKEDIAWSAAFFEGEGGFSITLNERGKCTGYASVGNWHRERIDKLQHLWGGIVKVFKTGGKASVWQWHQNRKKAFPFLEAILPVTVAPFQQKEIVVYLKFFSPATSRDEREELFKWWQKRKVMEGEMVHARMNAWLKEKERRHALL